jgi:hypothetical protein
MKTKRTLLSYLWLFALLNYLYCDIVSLMDSGLLKQYIKGQVNGMIISQEFLLAASILMEIPVAMILISRFANDKLSLWSNRIAACIMSIVQFSTLMMGKPSLYYVFFSAIEIATTLYIAYLSFSCKNYSNKSLLK